MKKSIECPFQKVFPSQLEKGDLFFMQLAYNEAVNAWTRDEVPVGAVIAMGEEVVAEEGAGGDGRGGAAVRWVWEI